MLHTMLSALQPDNRGDFFALCHGFARALRQQLVLWQVAAWLHLQPRLYHSQMLRFSFPLGKKVTLKPQDFRSWPISHTT